MTKTSSDRQPDPRLSPRGVWKYLNVVEAPKMENRKLMTLLVILTVAVVCQGIGVMLMLPLKERVPYVIAVEEGANGRPTGKVSVADSAARKFTPGEANIRYFLARWAEDLLSIDETSEGVRLPASYALLKGQALDDWQRYITQDGKPLAVLAEDPTYRQRAELISITFLSENTAMIRVKLTNNDGKVRRVQVNLTYALIPPTSDADIYRNPIGLWITTFGVTNELA